MITLLCSFLGTIWGLHRVAPDARGRGWLSAFCWLVVLLYIGALADVLAPVSRVALAVGLLLALVAIGNAIRLLVRRRRHPGAEPTDEQSPELQTTSTSFRWVIVQVPVVAVAVAFCFGLGDDFRFVGWDEFSHWALATKLMVAEDALFGTDSVVLFKQYPPAASLFQYHFAHSVQYTEAITLFAQFCLTLAALLATLKDATVRPLVALAALGALVFWIHALQYSAYEIYVDVLLGVLFGAALSTIAHGEGRRLLVALLIPLCICLTLTKHVGLLFALVVAGATIAQALVAAFRVGYPTRQQALAVARREAVVGGCLLAALALAQISWMAYYTSIQATTPFQPMAGLMESIEAVFAPSTDLALAIREEFTSRFLHGTQLKFSAGIWSPSAAEISVSPAAAIAALAGLSLLTAAGTPRHRRAAASLTLLVASLGALAYTAFLIAAYNSAFQEYEARNLASFERYLGSYLIGWGALLISLLASAAAERKLSARGAFIVVALSLVFFTPRNLRETILMPADQRPVVEVSLGLTTYAIQAGIRREQEALAETVRAQSASDARVYYVSQHENGYTFWMFRYLIAPHPTNNWCWSLGEPYGPGDIWTCDVSLHEALEGFDVLVVRQAGEDFWARFGQHFEPEDVGINMSVFRIARRDGELSLVRVPPQPPGTPAEPMR